MADINFARFPFKFPAYFWEYKAEDPKDTQLTIFTFTFPAFFYEEPE